MTGDRQPYGLYYIPYLVGRAAASAWKAFKDNYDNARNGDSSGFRAERTGSGLRNVSLWIWTSQHVHLDHITLGVVVLVFGFFGAQINGGLAWLAFGLGILLLTWHTRMPTGVRALIFLVALAPILYWFDKVSTLLFPHPVGADRASLLELGFRFGFAAAAVIRLLVVVRRRPQGTVRTTVGQNRAASQERERWSNIPSKTFRDVGGMHEEKRRIARVVKNRLHPERFAKHGVIQNGILLWRSPGEV